MGPAYDEPPFGVKFRKRACAHKIGVHDHASSANPALDTIAGHALRQDCSAPRVQTKGNRRSRPARSDITTPIR
jgi:hypothetical protein